MGVFLPTTAAATASQAQIRLGRLDGSGSGDRRASTCLDSTKSLVNSDHIVIACTRKGRTRAHQTLILSSMAIPTAGLALEKPLGLPVINTLVCTS